MAGFVDKFKRMWDAPDDEYQQEYDEYGYADENEEEEVEEQQPVRERAAAPTSKNKVVNINAKAKIQVGIYKPERFGEETRTIADDLIKSHTVVLNLEDTNKDMARRILDFLSGVAYPADPDLPALAANLEAHQRRRHEAPRRQQAAEHGVEIRRQRRHRQVGRRAAIEGP